MDVINNLILQELQETRRDIKDFRIEVANWRSQIATQLAEHETKIEDVSGNGQPGRMSDAEEDIAQLKKDKYRLMGIAAGVGGAASIIFGFARVALGL